MSNSIPPSRSPQWHVWVIGGVPVFIAVCWFIRDFDFEPLLVMIEVIALLSGFYAWIMKRRFAHWIIVIYGVSMVCLTLMIFFQPQEEQSSLQNMPTPVAAAPVPTTRTDFWLWPIVYETSFESGASQWINSDKDDPWTTLHTEVRDESLIASITTKRDVTTWVDSPLPHPRNFALTFSVKKLSGPKDGSCGSIFQWTDGKGGYYFRISPEQQRFDITYQRSPDGTIWDSVFGGWQSSATINADSVNRVTLLADGTQLEVIVNDRSIGQTTSLAYDAGMIDLALQYPHNEANVVVTCQFDDVVVREKPKP